MALPNTIEVTVDADTAAAVAQVVAASKAMQKSLDDINASVNFPNQDKEAERSGEDANKAWWKGYEKEDKKGSSAATSRLTKLFKKWTSIVALFGETIGVSLYGASGAILSVGASLASAVGASAALVPVLVGVGAAIGVIAVGVSGVSDGFKAVNEEWAAAIKEGRDFNLAADGIKESLAGLAPAAQAFVLAFGGIRGELNGIKLLVQENLFAGLAEAMTAFAESQLAGIGQAFAGIATVVNQTFKDVLAAVSAYPLGLMLDALTPIIANVLGALAPLTTAFLGFLQTATPYANELSVLFKQWAEDLARFVQSAEGTSAIQDFLARSLESLRSWSALLGAVGRAFSTFIRIASGEGDGLVDSLTGVINTFNEWMSDVDGPGPKAVLDFLETSTRLVKALGPVLEGLVGFFDELVTPDAVARFEDLASTIGDILPLLGKLLSAFSETGTVNLFADALLGILEAAESSGLLDALRDLGSVINESLGNVIQSIVDSGVLETLGTGISLIAETLGELLTAIFSNEELLTAFEEGLAAIAEVVVALLPVVLSLVPVLLSFLPAITGILELLPPLAELILALMPAIELIVGAMLIWSSIQVALFGFIQDVVFVVLETLIGWLTDLVNILTGAVVAAIEGLSAAWEATTKDITEFYERNVAPILGKITGLFTGIKDTVIRVWDGMFQAVKDIYQEFFGGFISDVAGYAEGAKQTFTDMWTNIKEAFSGAIDFIKGLWTDFKSALTDTKQDVKDTWNDIVSFFNDIPERIGSALEAVVEAITGPFRRAWEKAKEYVDKIKNLPSNIAGGIGGFVSGLIPGAAAGGLFMGETVRRVGEQGPEAVIPLHRPLSQIDPSVRAMAALLRNGGTGGTTPDRVNVNGGGRTVNANFTINDATGSAEATATKVMNRLVSL